MKCTELNELISLYIDNLLDEHTNEVINDHIQECSTCRSTYQELRNISEQCRKLPTVELPDDFEISLHEKLVVASREIHDEKVEPLEIVGEKNQKKKINWKVFTSIAAIFMVFIISVAAVINLPMKSSQKEEMRGEQQMLTAGSAPEPMAPSATARSILPKSDSGLGDNGTEMAENVQMDMVVPEQENKMKVAQEDGRKVIKSAYVNIDVMNYDEKFNQIMNTTLAYGGYIENSNTEYRYYNANNPEESLRFGNMLIRVPESQMENIVEQIKNLGNVTNFGIHGSDITLQYRDTANEVENLKIQEARLREIMGKANVVKDILEIERELSRTRGEINRMTGDIKRWDDLVSLSTVHVSLNEISPKDQQIEPPSEHVWNKARKGFIKTINQIVVTGERIFVRFVSILPLLLLVAIVALPLIGFIIRILKKKKE